MLERAICELQSTFGGVSVVELEGDAALDGRICGALLQPRDRGRVNGVVGATVAAPEAAAGVLETARPVHRPCWLLQNTSRMQKSAY
jgi:hypothetical protein